MFRTSRFKSTLYLLLVGALWATGCEEEITGPGPTMDTPALDALPVNPGMVCDVQHPTDGSPLVITGTGFSPVPIIDGDKKEVILPEITLTQTATLEGGAGDNQAFVYKGRQGEENADKLSWQSQSQMTLTYRDSELPVGVYTLTMVNLNGNQVEAPSAVAIVPPPEFDETNQQSICVQDGSAQVTLTGQNFLSVNGTLPAVTVDGSAVTTVSVGGCTALSGIVTYVVERCTEVTIELPQEALTEPRDVTVELTNPEPANCLHTSSSILRIVVPPTLTGVSPSNICSDQPGETFTVTGDYIEDGATVTIGSTVADSVVVTNPGAPGSEAVATFNNGIPPGTYDVTVSNAPNGCEATIPDAIEVDPAPIVFFVDPPVLYNGVSIEVTIFATNLDTAPVSVELVDSSGNVTDIPDFTTPVRPNRIQATIPSGLTAGQYEVRVTNDIGCFGLLPGGITVTDTLTLALLSADPAFVSPSEPTAITITAEDPAPAGEVQFVSTPRAYLNPNPPVSGTTAIALRAVVQRDATTLTAVVPGGLTPSAYDLIVVNPTGEVGLLDSAITVTSDEPPVVNKILPATFAANADYTGTLFGENFDTSGVTVDFVCQAPDGTQTSEVATVNGGSLTATSVDVTFPTSGKTAGSICVVVLTNDSGASFRFSAVSITNSSFNLAAWNRNGNQFPPSMNEARRGLGLAAGRPTNTSRYLYAFGGDDGNDTGLLRSVEASPVDLFGEMDPWQIQVNQMDEARSFFGYTTLDRFVYVTGGTVADPANAGQITADNSVVRAQILDPLDTPEIIDLDVALGDGNEGLGGGTWIYRVTANFPNDDASNPNGESLPGEALVATLPDRTELLQLTLQWAQIPGANGYNIYRTPTADGTIDQVEFLATVSGGDTLTYTDTGTATTAGVVPLPPGSLGVWHTVAPMNVNRTRHATVAAPAPGTPNTWYLYAFGGENASGTVLASFEYATVTVAANGSQTVSAWQNGTGNIGQARRHVGAFVMTAEDSPLLTGDQVAVYVGPGDPGGGQNDKEFVVEIVPNDGDFASFRAPANSAGSLGSARWGYGYGQSNGYLYLFGGGTDTAQASGVSGRSDTALETYETGSFNSLGISMQESRIYMGSAQESAFYFVAGGFNGTAATNTVDQTVQ